MSVERFDHLTELIRPFMEDNGDVRGRPQVISTAEKLAITLHYLATGNSQQSESYDFRVGRSTVSYMVKQTTEAIWQALSNDYLKFPASTEQWEQISAEFEEDWDLPHVLGALDGKHFHIECPKFGGSLYYNYKGFHSLVMMAMCDSKYRFIYVDIGHYGRDNDASIFGNSPLFDNFNCNKLPIPQPKDVHGKNTPYFLVGDDIFPLKPWLMKPYSGRGLVDEQRVFNYRLSRARRTIENAFGILSAKWRIFRRAIRADTSTTDLLVKAAVCLHNYLLSTENARYIPSGFVDCDDANGLQPGDWRSITSGDREPAFQDLRGLRIASNNYNLDSKEVRDHLKEYVTSEAGTELCPWQWDHVRSCGVRVDDPN